MAGHSSQAGTHAASARILYRDLPLDQTRFDTRFWKFAPDSTEMSIRLHMSTISKSANARAAWTKGTYIALSYLWGNPVNTRTLVVNERSLSVTANLYQFLRVLQRRVEFSDKWFWADQISMDQEHTSERDYQVSRMADIYSGARTVFAYLGEELLNVPFTFGDKRMQNVSRVGAYLDFFTRPYWSRIWIVQEVLLARNVFLWCGSNINTAFVSLESLLHGSSDDLHHEFCEVAHEERFEFPKLEEKAQIFHKDHGRKVLHLLSFIRLEGRTRMSLQAALWTFGHNQCSDSRDKIFGLQSVVEQRQRIPVDYSLSTSELLVKVLRSMVIHMPMAVATIGTQSVDRQRRSEDWRLTSTTTETTIHELIELGERLMEHSIDVHSYVKAISWANLIAFLANDVVDILIGENIWTSWQSVWTRVQSLASTPEQRAVAETLNTLSYTYRDLVERLSSDFQREFIYLASRSEWIRVEAQGIWIGSYKQYQRNDVEIDADMRDFCKELIEAVSSMISQAAAQHGFVLTPDFFYHPEKWPFGDEVQANEHQQT